MIENIGKQDDYIESPLFEIEEFDQLKQEVVGSNVQTYNLNIQNKQGNEKSYVDLNNPDSDPLDFPVPLMF